MGLLSFPTLRVLDTLSIIQKHYRAQNGGKGLIPLNLNQILLGNVKNPQPSWLA